MILEIPKHIWAEPEGTEDGHVVGRWDAMPIGNRNRYTITEGVAWDALMDEARRRSYSEFCMELLAYFDEEESDE